MFGKLFDNMHKGLPVLRQANYRTAKLSGALIIGRRKKNLKNFLSGLTNFIL